MNQIKDTSKPRFKMLQPLEKPRKPLRGFPMRNRGYVCHDIEAQESSSMIREAQEAAPADVEAPASSPMICGAHEAAASARIEAQESSSLISDAT